MSYAQSHTVTVTTATGGGGTGYTPVVTGRIAAVTYTQATGGLASTSDLTVTTEDTAQSVWSATNINATTTVHPVAAANLPSGAASSLTEVPIYACGERVKIAVAQGGNTKTGSFQVVLA